MKQPAVYILASKRNGTLYVGVTSNLPLRVEQHKTKYIKGFTQQYNVTMLVWMQYFDSMEETIAAESALKGWNRKWKIALIEDSNPSWKDLSELTGKEEFFLKMKPYNFKSRT